MAGEDSPASTPLLKRKTTRRAIVAASVAAGSVAAAYAALGDKLDLFGGGSSPAPSTTTALDTDALKKESVRVNHLLRRAGFGMTRDEYDRYQSMGLKATIDELVNYTSINDDDAVDLANQIPTDAANRQNLPGWWIVRIANTKRPLQEKMTFFWSSLLTSQLSVVRDPKAMLRQNEFFRSHALDRFDDVLRGITLDPAMMVYLDMNGSQKRAPNENYARELMELFSMGVGNYTEQDVREAARSFTGWIVRRTPVAKNEFTLGDPIFQPSRFDDGSKTFLGKTGNFRYEDIVDNIVQQPASAKFIARRLFSFFVYPEPDDKALQPFLDVYSKSNRNIGSVVEAILRSDVFYSPQAYRAIVKSPVEYVVGAVKALGAQQAMAPLLARAGGSLVNMGQIPFEPPNVAGWPGGPTWLNSATMFARLNFVNQLTAINQPGAQVAAQQTPLGTAQQALDHYLPFVLDDNVPADARQVFIDFADSAEANLTPDKLRGLAYLVLASPQFHLA